MQGIERIYLARHGRTEWNVAGRRQGQLASPLVPGALDSAELLARRLVGSRVEALFSSPLGRAAGTAAVFARQLELEVVTIDELAEVDHGAMSGLTNAEIEARYPGELEGRRRDTYRWSFPADESYPGADRRAAAALASSRTPAAGSRSPSRTR